MRNALKLYVSLFIYDQTGCPNCLAGSFLSHNMIRVQIYHFSGKIPYANKSVYVSNFVAHIV